MLEIVPEVEAAAVAAAAAAEACLKDILDVEEVLLVSLTRRSGLVGKLPGGALWGSPRRTDASLVSSLLLNWETNSILVPYKNLSSQRPAAWKAD